MQAFERKASADRIILSEVLPRQCLIDDRDFARIVHFNFGEGSPVELSDAKSAKVSFAYKLEDGLPSLSVHLAGNLNFRRDTAVRRQRAGFRRGNDPRQCRNALQKRAEELLLGGDGGVLSAWQRNSSH